MVGHVTMLCPVKKEEKDDETTNPNMECSSKDQRGLNPAKTWLQLQAAKCHFLAGILLLDQHKSPAAGLCDNTSSYRHILVSTMSTSTTSPWVGVALYYTMMILHDYYS